MPYPDLKPEHRYTAESMVKVWVERAEIEVTDDVLINVITDIANELCAYERVGYGTGISDAKQLQSRDAIPMEDPGAIPEELEISDEAKGFLDRIIKLNTEAMGSREEWDAHGNATLDLVREMAGRIDEIQR